MNLWNAGQKLYDRVTRLGDGRPRMKLLYELPDSPHGLCQMRVRTQGQDVDLWVRRQTTDVDLLSMILGQESMYALPGSVDPRVIFDVGANIGIAAVYFALRYPNANIWCFEPLPENQDLLRRNTEGFDRIRIMPFGLSDKEGTFTYCMSNNPGSFGGGTFCGVGHDPARSIELPLRTAAAVIEEEGLDRVDLLKIDTEGSELAILQGVPEKIRQNAQAYIGELHGIGDWQFCDTLSQTHQVGVEKRYSARCFPFMAVRHDLAKANSASVAA